MHPPYTHPIMHRISWWNVHLLMAFVSLSTMIHLPSVQEHRCVCHLSECSACAHTRMNALTHTHIDPHTHRPTHTWTPLPCVCRHHHTSQPPCITHHHTPSHTITHHHTHHHTQGSTFNIKGVTEHAHFLREIGHADAIRNKLIENWSLANVPGRWGV